ncbi:hypothetical protein [Dokdonella sp.]|uniref:hypothetical protein n=1 Tax=Dokdonella sp. TaxID=2291710 RepID=UPI003528279A
MRSILLASLTFSLCACGGSGGNQAAVDACMAEANSRLAGKSFVIDSEKFAASAEAADGAAGMLQLSAPIVFDQGLESEFTQVFKCKVRQDASGASVISLEFIWSMDDLDLGK